jgi:hypothetical protein
MEQSSDYIDVFRGALGSGEVWARLLVTCPSTGTIVYDSGERREDTFCEQGKQFLFLVERHAQREASHSCCPNNLKCPR